MVEINWLVWAGCWLGAWAAQNVLHELSHLWTGWVCEGRQPLKLIPWPHVQAGRFYFARYECGPATKAGSETYRHSAPMRWAGTQVVVGLAMMLGSVLGSWVLGWWQGCDMAWYLVPFVVCPAVDAGVWVWGYVRRRPGTDGDRWRQATQSEGLPLIL